MARTSKDSLSFVFKEYGLESSPWPLKRLTDYVYYQEGPGLRNWQWTNEGMKVINITNILGEGIVDTTNTERYISLSEFYKTYTHFEVQDGDIVMASSGWSYGKVGRIKSHNLPLMMNTSVIRFRSLDTGSLENDFLFYFLTSKYMKRQIDALITIADKPNFGPIHIKRMSIPLPEIFIQRLIGKVLRRYDELIENNRRRIQLLEEAARCRYKLMMDEPSHWEKVPVQQAINYHIGGGWGNDHYLADFTKPAYVIRGTDIPGCRSGDSTGVPFRYHKESNLRSRKLEAGDVVFEVSGGSRTSPVGRALLVGEELLSGFDSDVMCASFCKLLRPGQSVTPEYLYLFLLESYENGTLKPFEKSSASNIINFAFETYLQEAFISVPPRDILEEFSDQVRAYLKLIANLGKQNVRLRQARDILIPRLISGEIDVNSVEAPLPQILEFV